MRQTMRGLMYLMMPLAVIALVTPRAQANITLFSSGQGAPNQPCSQSLPNECSFVEGLTGDTNVTELQKLEKDGSSGGFSASIKNAPYSVSWTNITAEAHWVLVLDGGGGEKYYNLYQVSSDQYHTGGGTIYCCGSGEQDTRDITGVTFMSSTGVVAVPVPEPSLLVLLGTGLAGTLAFARWFI